MISPSRSCCSFEVSDHLRTYSFSKPARFQQETNIPKYLQSSITRIFNIFFSVIASPYYLLFGEKEYWMNAAPSPVHYNSFNNGWLRSSAERARKNMAGLLDRLGGVLSHKRLAGGILPSWSGIDLSSLSDDDRYFCGDFYLTGREIKDLASSLRVSYDPSIVSSYELCDILANGSESCDGRKQARGRMVSSLVVSICDSRGSPISRKEELSPYRVYTSNAPNVAYNRDDYAAFVDEDGAFKKEKYTAEIERLLSHFFEEAENNADDTIVLCGFGLGAYMQKEFSDAATQCFAEALGNAMNERGNRFKKVIFADPNGQLSSRINKVPNIIVSNKSCLDIAHVGAEQGYKVALFNPGDESGIPGQFWFCGHVALEEMFGLFTTLLLSQHPDCNQSVKESWQYVSR